MDLGQFMVAVGLAFISLIMKEAVNSIKELKNSVVELNLKMAVIVEKLEGHEERIKKLEDC